MLTKEQKKYIEDNYKNKEAKQIAQELGIAKSKVTNHLWKNNFTKNNQWTEYDDNFIKENYMKMSYSQIGKILNKTESACQQHARKLGIPRKLSGPNTWSKDEINYLKEHIKTDLYESICKTLNRTRSSVYNKVYELKLIPENAKGYKKVKLEQIYFILANYDKFTDFELGQKFGLSAEAVAEIRKKNGIDKSGSNSHKETYIEKIIRHKLEDKKINFIYNQPFGRFIPDFRLEKENIIIEVNGDYYHCNPDIYPEGPKDDVQIKHVLRDYYKMCFYKNQKYKVYYFWENDIINKPEEIDKQIEEIYSAVQKQNSREVSE